MRFTKGKNAYIVCTHIDKAHIHNHIIISAVNLDCDRKFRNFWDSPQHANSGRVYAHGRGNLTGEGKDLRHETGSAAVRFALQQALFVSVGGLQDGFKKLIHAAFQAGTVSLSLSYTSPVPVSTVWTLSL